MSKTTKTVWKEFSKNKITHSGAHYLMAIHNIKKEQGYARLSDVAKRLKISKGSLSTSLKSLIKKKLIVEDDNKHLDLSEEGQAYAENIENTYAVVKHLLSDVLGVDKSVAEVDACKVEHLLSFESTNKLLKFVKALENDSSLREKILDEMGEFKNCDLHGCKDCKKGKFCLKD